MSLAALAKQLADIGTPIEGIILALEAVESRDKAAAEKREQAAERKRRQRERERDSHGTVTGHGGDIPPETPSLDKSPQTPKINPIPYTHGEGAPTREAAPKLWACPEGVELPHWRDFLGNRRRKKLGTSETAYLGQLKLLERFSSDEWPPGELIRIAAEKGWGTIVDPSEYETPRNGKRASNDHRPHRRADEIDDALGALGFGGGLLAR